VQHLPLSYFFEIKAESGQVSAASVFGQFGAIGAAPYCATKAAVTSMSQVAAKENPDIRINCVAPGKTIPMSLSVH
jgi:NAD(P)-dependent dehydrogenase (short-subunit alcohol dehydrogenase family)